MAGRFFKFLVLVLLICGAYIGLFEYLFRNYQNRADQLFGIFDKRLKTVETLYIGSSHIGAFVDVFPDSDMYVGNMSFAGQDIFRMYTVIKTVVPECPHLKKIYLGVDYEQMGYNQVKNGEEYIDRQFYRYTKFLYNNTFVNRTMSASNFFRSNRDMSYLFTRHKVEPKKLNFIPIGDPAITAAKSNPVTGKRWADDRSMMLCRKRAEEHSLFKFKTKFIPENLQYLQDIVDICRQYNIQLVMVNTPKTQCYKEYVNKNNIAIAKETIDSFALACKTPFLDFYDDTSFIDDNLFQDFDHLNPVGAKMLSDKLDKIVH